MTLYSADTEARIYTFASDLIGSIDNIEALRWYVRKEKKQYLPCFVVPEHQKPPSPSQQRHPVTTKVEVIFLGRRHKDEGLSFMAGSKTLHPFNVGEKELIWSQEYLKNFKSLIGKDKRMKDGEGLDYNLYVNERILVYALQRAKENQEKREQLLLLKPNLQQDDDGDEDVLSLSSPINPPTPSSPPSEPAAAVEAPRALSMGGSKKFVLRAGDEIRLHDPAGKATGDPMTAMIVRVHPKDELALQLNNGLFVPRDHQVQLSRRLLRGKLVRQDGVPMQDVSDYDLDPKRNGKVTVQTKAQQIGAMFKETVKGLESGALGMLRGDENALD